MILMEQMAYKKICPFAKNFDASVTRMIDPPAYATKQNAERPQCIGSACMAWDWLDPVTVTPNVYIVSADGNTAEAAYPGFNDLIATQPEETPEDRSKRITEAMEADGWTRTKNSVASTAGWNKPHPARRGQCQRVVTTSQE